MKKSHKSTLSEDGRGAFLLKTVGFDAHIDPWKHHQNALTIVTPRERRPLALFGGAVLSGSAQGDMGIVPYE